MSVKKIPLRQCIGCGEMKSKKEMINEIMNGNYTNGGFLSSLDADEIKELLIDTAKNKLLNKGETTC